LVHRQPVNRNTPQVHVIAHSLGNRILLEAVHRLVVEKRIKGRANVFGNVVLAAADVDWPTFATQAPSVVSCTKRLTYYYSTEDFALKLSQTLHGQKPPIGLCPMLHPHVDTINADNVNELAIGFGHRYFSSSCPMLVDMNLLLTIGLPPDERQPPLGNKQVIAGYSHWEFVPFSR
jgi:esterase/lipase superfamily enzyme